jgi:hypothetical protein
MFGLNLHQIIEHGRPLGSILRFPLHRALWAHIASRHWRLRLLRWLRFGRESVSKWLAAAQTLEFDHEVADVAIDAEAN